MKLSYIHKNKVYVSQCNYGSYIVMVLCKFLNKQIYCKSLELIIF